MFGPGSPVKIVSREFTYNSEPRRLLSKLKEISSDERFEKAPTPHLAGSLPDGSIFTWEPEELRLSVGELCQLNWLDHASLKIARLFP